MNNFKLLGNVANPVYTVDRYGKLQVVIIPREFENSIQDEIISLKEELVGIKEDFLVSPVIETKTRQLLTLSMEPNIVYSTSSTGFEGGVRQSPLTQCLQLSFLLRGNKGVLRISPSSGNGEPYRLRPAGFLQTFIAPHHSEYYITYIPEDPLDITERVLEIDYIFTNL